MQLWHGTEDDTLDHVDFGEEIEQWTNVHGLGQTPAGTDQDPEPEPGDGDCSVTVTTNAWNAGPTTSLTITNTTPVDGWSLSLTLPDGQAITSGWNATYTPRSGAITATNASCNATIAPDAGVSIGYQATHTGNAGEPTAFTLNGSTCSTV